MNKGWQTRTLGDVCTMASGGTPPKDNPRFWVGDIPFVSARDLKSDRIETAILHISSDAVEQSAAKLAPVGSLLILVRGMGLANGIQIGEVTAPVAFNQDIRALVAPSSFLPRFLLLALRSRFVNDGGESVLSAAAHGTLKIDADVLRQIPIHFPSLSEQKRIVGVLDEAFSGLATAQAHVEKNLQNARALFESYLQSVFIQRGKGWAEKRKPLEELCELIVDCEHKTAPIQEEGIPSIRTPNIGKGKLLLSGVNRVSEETYKAWTRRAEPLPGDLILAREAPAGNVAVIPENTRVCLGQRTVLIRPKANVFESSFLAFLLLESGTQAKLLAHSRGATVQHVNMKDIRALDVGAMPSLEVQRSVSYTHLTLPTNREV